MADSRRKSRSSSLVWDAAFASLRSPSECLTERFRQRAEQAPNLRQRPSRSWACVFGISSGPDTAGINEVLYGPVISVSNRF